MRALPLEHLWGTRVLVHFEHDVAVTFLLENRFGRCLAHAAENNISRSGSGEIFAWSGCVGARHIFNSQSRCATSIAWLGAFLQAPQCVGMQQLCCNTAVSLLLLLFLLTPVLLLPPLPPPAFSASPTSACTPAWPSCGASQPPRDSHIMIAKHHASGQARVRQKDGLPGAVPSKMSMKPLRTTIKDALFSPPVGWRVYSPLMCPSVRHNWKAFKTLKNNRKKAGPFSVGTEAAVSDR
jgi:hypothetical protein